MKKLIILLAALLIQLSVVTSFAAPLRVYVADITVTVAQSGAEMKQILQTLLASRLNSATIVTVGSAAEADVVVSGSYTAFGRVFSLDAVGKTAGGAVAARAYVQGEGQDDLIPAVGKLADKLSPELVKVNSTVPSPAVSGVIASEPPIQKAPTGDVIRPKDDRSNSGGGWLSKRLDGVANLMALGKTLPDGRREVFLAEERRLSYYRQGSEMQLVTATEFKNTDKIISVDTIAAGDGATDIYVTIIRSGEPSSQVWQVKGDALIPLAEKLPYYFRTVGLGGEAKKLYAQSMGRDSDFFGDVTEATRNGAEISLKNRIEMPRYGTIYTFNTFRDRGGKLLMVVINPDGYLIVFDQQQKELWRSNDKFGGSELFFNKAERADVRVIDDATRWIFMNQRLQVLPNGEILVGFNDGFWVLGNARSYKKGAVYCFGWNGSSLEEKWRTKETQNYMPDYYFDGTRNELLMLQTVARPRLASTGASTLTIKKVE